MTKHHTTGRPDVHEDIASTTNPATPEQATRTGEPRRVIVIEDEDLAAGVLPLVPLNKDNRSDVRVNDEADRRLVGETIQERDADSTAAAGPVGIVTRGQARGALLGTVIGALIGAVVFLPLGFVYVEELAVGWRFALAALLGAIAGAVAGAVFGGGFESDREERPRHPNPTIVVGYDEDRRSLGGRASG